MSDENKMAELFAEQRGRSAGSTTTMVPDFTKRRLVRGAVASAPVLLTLRSGALAAESCTGVRFSGVQTRDVTSGGGTITEAIQAPSGLPTPGYTPHAGDTCVANYFECSATSPEIPSVKNHLPLGMSSSIGTVTESSSGSGIYQCKNDVTHSPMTGALAITSVGSISSFT